MSVMEWGDATEFVTFGKVGKDEVDEATDVYILVAPQNIVGNTIMTVRFSNANYMSLTQFSTAVITLRYPLPPCNKYKSMGRVPTPGYQNC